MNAPKPAPHMRAGDGPRFAGVVLMVLGVLNTLHALALLGRREWFGEDFVAVSSEAYAVVFFVLAALQLFAGIKLFRGRGGRGLALGLACFGLIAWLMLSFVFVFGGLIGMIVNFAVIAVVLSSQPDSFQAAPR